MTAHAILSASSSYRWLHCPPSARRYKEQDSWPAAPALKEDDFYHLQEIMELAGELHERAPYDELVTNEFAEKAAK
jgi:hypothetical protein